MKHPIGPAQGLPAPTPGRCMLLCTKQHTLKGGDGRETVEHIYQEAQTSLEAQTPCCAPKSGQV